MKFCPSCGNMLLVQEFFTNFRFFCQSCTYEFHVSHERGDSVVLPRKKLEMVIGGQDDWKNVDQTEGL